MIRNAQAEAFDRLGGRYEARVLEPSPPADNDPSYFADDPVARGVVPPDRQLVSPVSTGDLLWQELASDDDELAAWSRERWLGPYKRLEHVPESFTTAREELHRIAEHVMKPAREKANGKFGLRYTLGGFGTPFFGEDVQLRVQRNELIEQRRDREERSTLEITSAAAAAVGDWFGFAYSVLEQLRAEAADALKPSRVQIWPEHFDAAAELGAEAAGQRAAYGASPGDEEHPEPYLYVAPWTAEPTGELWQAEGFTGAELPYSELLATSDQRSLAISFFQARLQELTSA